MTALTQEVLKDMSRPSGSPPTEPSTPVTAPTPEPDELEAEMQNLVNQSSGIHPRAVEMSEKLRAFLVRNGWDYGVHIKTMKGKKPAHPGYGYNWIESDPDTILALVLDYHENPFWLQYRNEQKLNRFLYNQGCRQVKLDCTRWFIIQHHKKVAEGVEPEDLVNATVSAAKKPRFVPYKSIHTGDVGMALKIDWPESITQAQWSKISRMMQQKGYDIRGAADAQRFVYGYMQKFNNQIPPVLQDWIDTIALVLDLKAPSQSPDVKTAGATPASKVFRRAIKEWGTTHDPALAGYILPSGAMLDLSGSGHGGGTNRAYDHRQVEQFFDEHFPNRTDAMHAFMDMGAIRWMPEANALDIRKPPTGQQLTTIRHILSHVQGKNVYVDVFWPNYGKSAAEYPGRTSAERIVHDIQAFYKTGELPRMSQVQQMHLAAESAVDTLLRSTTKPLKEASYAARGVAAILLEAEQLDLPLDSDAGDDDGTDPMSTDEIGHWLNSIGILKGYEQIDGDYGDPWVYGGTWFSQGVENDPNTWDSIIHIEGLERDGLDDYDSRSKKVLKMMVEEPRWRDKVAAYVAARMPEKLVQQGIDGEPATDPETVEWCRKEATDEANDEIGEQVAELLNNARKMDVYRTNADDPNNESWVTDRLSSLLSSVGLTHAQWMEMGPAGRVCAVADYHGWHEIDSGPIRMNKQELSEKLGIAL